MRDWLDAKVRTLAPGSGLWIVAAGSAHATDLLAADASLVARLSEWLAARLSRAPASSAPSRPRS